MDHLANDLSAYTRSAEQILSTLLTVSIPNQRYATTAAALRRARKDLLNAQRALDVLLRARGEQGRGRPAKSVQRVIGGT
jgi:hypothetical protein